MRCHLLRSHAVDFDRLQQDGLRRTNTLQRLGLADETQPGTWAVHADAEKTLRALGERGDIIRTMQRAMRGKPRELAVFEPGDDGRTIIGRVAGEGAGRRAARPRLSGHRRRGRQGPLRRAERPRRTGELSRRRGGGGTRFRRGAGGRQEHRRAGERWPVPRRPPPGDRARPSQGRPRSAGSRRGPCPPAGSPAPCRHRGARGRGLWKVPGDLAERGRQYDAQRLGGVAVEAEIAPAPSSGRPA
jgi:hypothetical protein